MKTKHQKSLKNVPSIIAQIAPQGQRRLKGGIVGGSEANVNEYPWQVG